MVTSTADSSSNHHSPTAAATATTAASADPVAVTNIPRFPRKNLPSPWAQVVRGPDTEPPSAAYQSPPSSSSSSSSLSTSAAEQPAPSSDPSPPVENANSDGAAAAAAVDSSDADKASNSSNNNNAAGRPKKPAWKRPSNGVADSALNVMGAVSWPPLSESTKPFAKSTPEPSSSNKTASDGSLPTPQAHVTSHPPQKQAAHNAKPNPGPSYGVVNRQRTMKRGGGNSIGPGHAQSNFSGPPPPPPPPFPVLQIPPSTFGNGVPGVPDPSPRDHYRNNNWGPRPPVGGFVPPMIEQRSSSRRGNFGHHPRGDGSYHNNYGNRRDQDRGNYPHARDPHLHPPRVYARGIMRPRPPNAPSFMGPQPMRPFANPAAFPEFYYFPTSQFEPFGGMPFFTHGPPPAMFYPVEKTPLNNMIVNQIDYYFSDGNLVKDEYLRSNMDEQGWIPITLIASFPRVKSLTSSIEVILDSMRTSTVVEVQGDKLRRCNEWTKWLPSAPRRADSGSTSPGGSSSSNPAADFEKITLSEATAERVNSDLTTNGEGDATEESSSQFELTNGDATGAAVKT